MSDKKVEYKLLKQHVSTQVDKLMEIYRQNPYGARVTYFNSPSGYETSRLVVFEREKGNFEIIHFAKKFGISVTNRMYSRERKVSSIIYKDNKFYLNMNKKLIQLTLNGVRAFSAPFTTNVRYAQGRRKTENVVLDYLLAKFSWLRFVDENDVLSNLSFNSIIKYKLYNLNDALRHIFKAPLPTIKVIREANKGYSPRDFLKVWKEMSKVLINKENLSFELANHHMFNDACRMARTLDKKVNCSWSVKRLIAEHDVWAREITNIVMANEPLIEYNVGAAYVQFAKDYGYKLLANNKELGAEGLKQNHCVASYGDRINNGTNGIYSIEGYTLDLGYYKPYTSSIPSGHGKILRMNQFRGYLNCSAPQELSDRITKQLKEFNEKYKDKDFIPESKGNEIEQNINWLNDVLVEAEF